MLGFGALTFFGLYIEMSRTFVHLNHFQLMEGSKLLGRIEVNPAVLVGKPVIKGTRLSVQFIMGLLASDMTVDDILAEYPRLQKDDILACLQFATQALESNVFLPFEQPA